VTSFINIKYSDVAVKSPVNEQRAVIRFCGQKDLMQMRFTIRCVQCMATSVLRDQQYMFGVRSLLAAEKALLIRNDLAGMLLRRPMPWLPQLMLSYGPTAACQFQTLFGTPVFHDIQCTESSAIISSFGRCLLDEWQVCHCYHQYYQQRPLHCHQNFELANIDVYMSSAGTADRDLLHTDLLNELDILIRDYPDYNCLIGGDFNIDLASPHLSLR